MTVRTVSPEEYFSAFRCRTVFGSRAFIEATPAPEGVAVRYFIGYDENIKPRLGLIAGYDGCDWLAPYSAPFAEVAYNGEEHLERLYDFISELTDMLGTGSAGEEHPRLRLTLAPPFYDPSMLNKITGIFSNYAARTTLDFNYHYKLSGISSYIDSLDRAARKNLKRGIRAGFTFSPTDDIERAYAVILANRESHGYSLAMNLDRVKATIKAVHADFFLMTLGDADVAAAMVYHVADGIVQVIYWGDKPGYSELRPMNAFAYHLFNHYAALGIRIVDVGPASTHGIPNSGLCRFKESIGCSTTLRPTFTF